MLNYFSANYDQFRDFTAPTSLSAIAVDPFQTVDPFASQSDIGSPSTLTNSDWFQSSNHGTIPNDPFLSKTEMSPINKKIAPKKTSTIDPWGGSTTTTSTNHGNGWAQFNSNPSSNGNSSSGLTQYRALYDYKPERADEMAMSSGDVITVSSLIQFCFYLIRRKIIFRKNQKRQVLSTELFLFEACSNFSSSFAH